MNTIRKTTIILFLVWATLAFASEKDIEVWADKLMQAYQQGTSLPLLSTHFPDLTSAMAYQIQQAYVEKRLTQDKIAGFKAGLTSKTSQVKFGVDEPITGVLFASGKNSDGITIESKKFKNLYIEAEVGFITGKTITQTVANVTELQNYLQTILPVIELPDVNFENNEQLKGVDIIAANVSATQFVMGKDQSLQQLEPNVITMKFFHDGKLVNTGRASEVLGDQWLSLLWLINTVISQGYQIAPHHLFITGTLGKMLPGKPGKYVADYGNLGKVTFEIK